VSFGTASSAGVCRQDVELHPQSDVPSHNRLPSHNPLPLVWNPPSKKKLARAHTLAVSENGLPAGLQVAASLGKAVRILVIMQLNRFLVFPGLGRLLVFPRLVRLLVVRAKASGLLRDEIPLGIAEACRRGSFGSKRAAARRLWRRVASH